MSIAKFFDDFHKSLGTSNQAFFESAPRAALNSAAIALLPGSFLLFFVYGEELLKVSFDGNYQALFVLGSIALAPLGLLLRHKLAFYTVVVYLVVPMLIMTLFMAPRMLFSLPHYFNISYTGAAIFVFVPLFFYLSYLATAVPNAAVKFVLFALSAIFYVASMWFAQIDNPEGGLVTPIIFTASICSLGLTYILFKRRDLLVGVFWKPFLIWFFIALVLGFI